MGAFGPLRPTPPNRSSRYAVEGITVYAWRLAPIHHPQPISPTSRARIARSRHAGGFLV